MTMLLVELLPYLFDGQPHLLAESMATWLTSSRRFTAFVNTNHTKIRKKLRTARDPESLGDLRLELETAYLLLRERSLGLVYEPQHRERGRSPGVRPGRSPDFAVSFTTSFTFMVEVTRLRSAQKGTPPNDLKDIVAMPSPNTGFTTPPPVDRFSDMVCSKLGQFLPQISNLLLVGMDSPHLTHPDLSAVMLRIQQRAEGKDPAITYRYGFRDRADFFRHYQRLSAIILRGIPLKEGGSAVIWINSQAKYPLPARVNTVLYRSHTL